MFHTLSELNEKEKNKGKQNQKKNIFNMSKDKSPEDNYYGKGNKAYDHYNKRPSESLNVKFEKTKNKITLIVFQNGFILNNGPFRDRAIPENNKFMEEVERGNIPHELMEKGINDLGILLINRKTEIYHQPIAPITQITQITQINPITINPYNQISSFDFGQLNQLSQLGKINTLNPINKTTNYDNMFNYNYSTNNYTSYNNYAYNNNYTLKNNYPYNNNYIYNNNNTYKSPNDNFTLNNINYPYNNIDNYSLNNNNNNYSYQNSFENYIPNTNTNNSISYSYKTIDTYPLNNNNINNNYSYTNANNYPKQYNSKTQNTNQFGQYQFKDPLFLNIESLGYSSQSIPAQTPIGNRNVRKDIFPPKSAYTDNRNYKRYDRHTSSVPKKDMRNKFETFHNFKRLELIKEEEKKKENQKNKKQKNDEDDEKKEETEKKEEKGFTAFGGVGQPIDFVNTQGLNVQKDLKNSIDIFKPVCTINIRLFNGEIVKGQFNYTQTLRDIYYFVQKISGSNNFTLLDGFPPKPLRDYHMTIGQLKLENTILTQRIN